MKVWELMAELSKRPAGENVYIARSDSHTYQDTTRAYCSSIGEIIIYGDGSDDDGDDDES